MAKVIDATIRLIDKFTPTLKTVGRQIEQQQRANERMAKSVQATGRTLQNFGEKLLPVSAAAVGFGTYGVKAFGDFEQAMNKVKVKLDESDWGRFGELKEQAKQLSTQYAYSAAEIAEAQENIVAAGWNVNAVLSATPTVMNLAAAAGVDMATASSILTDNMTAFGIEAAKANGFADMLAVTANATNTDIPAMAESYKYCASAARAMGVDLADTSTLIGMLANSGIKGSEAGTSVKDMLERLAIPEHRANLEALGVVVKDAEGNFVGMRSVIDQTRNAMQGMDQLKKMEIIKEAFGSTALPGVMALLNQTTDCYDDLNKTIRDSAGTCQKAADVMNGGFNAELKKTGNAVSLAAMTIGEKLVPFIRAAGNEILYLANCIKGLSPAQVDLTIKIAGFVVGLTATLLVGGKMMVMFGGLGRSAVAFSVAVVKAGGVLPMLSANLGALANTFRVVGTAARLLFMNPIGIAIGVIALLAYAIYNNFGGIRTFLTECFESISGRIAPTIDRLKNKFSGLATKFWQVVDRIMVAWTKMSAAAENKGTLLHAVFNHIAVSWQNMCNIFTAAVHIVIAVISVVVDTIANVIGASIDGWIGIFDGFATFIEGLFSGDLSMACDGLVKIFSSAFSAIDNECTAVMNGIKYAINAVIGGINTIDVTIPDWVPVVGGQQYQPNIPMLARGTDNWQGGPAVIHDAGAEIVDLPQGSRVIPHDKSLQSEYVRGQSDGANKSSGINIIIQNMNVREEGDVDKIANAIAQKLQAHSMNSTICAV